MKLFSLPGLANKYFLCYIVITLLEIYLSDSISILIKHKTDTELLTPHAEMQLCRTLEAFKQYPTFPQLSILW